MEIRIDHPKIRASMVCPACKGQKAVSLVVCWECYHKTQIRYGNPRIEAILDKIENENG